MNAAIIQSGDKLQLKTERAHAYGKQIRNGYAVPWIVEKLASGFAYYKPSDFSGFFREGKAVQS